MKNKTPYIVKSLSTDDINAPLYKKENLVSLQTDYVSRFLRNNKELFNQEEIELYHLYFLSNEEIKEDDWVIDTVSNIVFKGKNTEYCRKIVYASDTSLRLPQIPYSFIKKYIDENGKIEKVWVEILPEEWDIEGEVKINEERILITPVKSSFTKDDMIRVAYIGYMYTRNLSDINTFLTEKEFTEWITLIIDGVF